MGNKKSITVYEIDEYYKNSICNLSFHTRIMYCIGLINSARAQMEKRGFKLSTEKKIELTQKIAAARSEIKRIEMLINVEKLNDT